MTNASTATPRTFAAAGTIDPQEAEHFGKLAADWWNPKGSSAMLHQLNPVRLAYIRDAIDMHFTTDSRALKPLAGKRVLDVGCGAGLLCEPLARLGADVTGLDAAAQNIGAAQAHAEKAGLDIRYHHGGIEGLDESGFDLVTSLEVIEHVTDPAGFVAGLSRALADDGLLIMSTPNRTNMSKLLLVQAAELTGQIPRGTHDWDKFLTPEELTALLEAEGLRVTDTRGLAFDPLNGLHLSENIALNYLVTAVRG